MSLKSYEAMKTIADLHRLCSFSILIIMQIFASDAADLVSRQQSNQGMQPPLIPRALLVANLDHTNVLISPDGRWIAYIGPSNNANNIWLMPVNQLSNATAKAVTHETGRGVEKFFWAFDNKHIIYLQDKTGSEKFQVFKLNVDTQQSSEILKDSDLSKRNQQLFVTLGQNALSLSPKRPNEIIVGVRSDKGQSDPYLVNIETGVSKRLAENPGYIWLVFDQNFNLRFGTTYTATGLRHDAYQANSGNWTLFKNISYDDNTLLDFVLGFEPTGCSVYWVDTTLGEHITLLRYDLNVNPPKREIIFQNKKSTSLRPTVLDPSTGIPLAVFEEYLLPEIVPISSKTAADIQFLNSSNNGLVVGLQATTNLCKWIVHFTRNGSPIDYYLYDRPSRNLKLLFSERESLKGQPLAPIYPVEVKTRDSETEVCYMTYPLEVAPYASGVVPKKRVPLVLIVHGGPYSRDSYEYNDKAQLYANRGYAALQCNFRGSIGYGNNWVKKSYGQWGGAMHTDILDAADWAVQAGITDAASIALTGHSYGGYETLFGITYSPDKFACAVGEAAARPNLPDIMESWPGHWNRPDYEIKLGIAGMPKEKAQEFLRTKAAMTYANQLSKPLYIGQGENDPRVTVKEVEGFVDRLKELNKTVTYVKFPNEGHELTIPSHKIANMALIENFLGKCLQGRSEPIGQDLAQSDVKVVEKGTLLIPVYKWEV